MYIDYWPLLLCIELKSTGNPTEQNTPFIDTHPAHVTTNSEASTTEEKKEKKKRKRLKHCREWVSVGWGERNEYMCVCIEYWMEFYSLYNTVSLIACRMHHSTFTLMLSYEELNMYDTSFSSMHSIPIFVEMNQTNYTRSRRWFSSLTIYLSPAKCCKSI